MGRKQGCKVEDEVYDWRPGVRKEKEKETWQVFSLTVALEILSRAPAFHHCTIPLVCLVPAGVFWRFIWGSLFNFTQWALSGLAGPSPGVFNRL